MRTLSNACYFLVICFLPVKLGLVPECFWFGGPDCL